MSPAPWVALAGALILASCPAGSARPKDVPALITNPTAESRAELAGAVSRALKGAVVPLADDALVHESTLVVERVRPRALEGAPIPGRETSRPEHFQLVRNGSKCVLIHEGSGEADAQRFTLESTTCSAH